MRQLMAWRRSSPLDPATALALRDDSRAQQCLSADSTFGFSFALLIVLGLLFWTQVNHRGLLSWLTMIILLSIGAPALRRLNLGFNDWLRLSIFHETLIGTVWGLAPLLALPHDPAWQALLGAVLGCVSLAASITNASFLSLHLAFLTPYTLIAAAGFALRTTGPARSFAFLLLMAFAFGIVVAHERRTLDHDMARSRLVNLKLSQDLETEHQRLRHTLHELEQANHQLEQQARTDTLTGLANRLGFNHLMNQAHNDLTHHKTPAITLAFLDLDGFKTVNDQYGHAAGDQVLQITTNRLQLVVTDNEHLARLGGDEIVLISPTTDPTELGDRLTRAFSWPYTINSHIIPIAASIGIATAATTTTTDELLQQADLALYQAKTTPGTNYHIHATNPPPVPPQPCNEKAQTPDSNGELTDPLPTDSQSLSPTPSTL